MTAPALDWAEVAQAVSEVVGSSVGWETPASVARRAGIPSDLSGAFIPLAGEGMAIQLGLTGTDASCRMLAAALLQCSADEVAALPLAEVADAVCEVVNIAAGHVKARLVESQQGIALGLPLFIHGAVQPGDRMDVDVFDLRFGEVPLVLVLLHRRG